jgi:hypothetical protein
MAALHFTVAERRARMAERHRLLASRRTDDVVAIARSVAALHSTDPATVFLTAMMRMNEPSIEAVSRTLYDDRHLVRHHAIRRTVWVFEPQLARAAHASCTAAQAVREWRIFAKMVEDSGIAADGAAWCAAARQRALEVITTIAPCTARQLGTAAPDLTAKLLLSQGKSYAGTQGAHTRVMQNLGFDGAIVRTLATRSWVGGEYTWAVAEQWVDGGLVDPALTAAEGAATVAAAYVRAFGPVTTTDVQWWAGWSATVTKAALQRAAAVAVTMEDADGATVDGWISNDDPALDGARIESEPWIALLPSLDPTIMGWKQRRWYMGDLETFGATVFDRNGNAGHSIWANGEVVGTWAQRADGEIVTELLRPVDTDQRRLIDARAEWLGVPLGESRVKPRYPAPLQAQLLA